MSKKTRCPQCKKMRVLQPSRTICHGCRTFNTAIKKGVIRKPDYKEVNTSNYKDPMQPVKGGFGYYGAITTTNDGKGIQCHICGFYYANLGGHVTNKHKVVLREYKIKHGLRIKEGLLSPVERENAQTRYNRHARKTRQQYIEMSRKGKKAREERGYKPGGNMWNAQTRNEKGMCKEQTLAKIRDLAERNNGVVKHSMFTAEYGSIDSVTFWFKTWENAVNEAGLKTYWQEKRKAMKKNRKDILDNIREFYLNEGRTPLSSDFNSWPTLPSQREVTKMFGTLNAARKAARVPEFHYVNGKWRETAEGEVVTPAERGFGYGTLRRENG